MRRESNVLGNESSSATPRQRGQACERCWKRKQKCDRLLPACTGCMGVDAQCIPRKFSIEPITNTGGGLSHAAIPSYVDTLKRKRDDLKTRARRQRQRQLDDAPSASTRPQQGITPADSNTDHTIQAAMGEIGFLSRSAMAEPRDETTSFTQGLAIGRMVRATLVLSGANPAQSTKDSSDGNMSALIEPSQVPRKHLAALLMSRFVDVVAVQFMHLSPLELWGDFDLFFRAPENPSQHLSECQPAKAFNVYIAMAIGSLLLPEQRSFQGLASNLHDAAMKLFPRMMSSGTKLDMLHCMILLTLYSLYSARGGSAWHHIGLAMKKAIAFRFHKDPDATIQISPEILRKRRNVFWSLYVLDRMISSIMDRPFSIEDEDITSPSPQEYASASSESECHLAIHIVAHARMISNIRDSSQKNVLFHFSNISYWKDSVAGSDPSAQFPGTCFMQLSCRAFVEIFRSKGSATTEYNLVHSSGAIKNEILKNSTEYIQEEYNRSDRGEFVGGFVDAYDIFAAGVVVICLSGEVSPPSRDNSIINKCTALLTLLGEKFSGLRVFRRVLWALSDYALGNPVTDTIIQEIPSIIPNGIKMVILRFIATGPVIST